MLWLDPVAHSEWRKHILFIYTQITFISRFIYFKYDTLYDNYNQILII